MPLITSCCTVWSLPLRWGCCTQARKANISSAVAFDQSLCQGLQLKGIIDFKRTETSLLLHPREKRCLLNLTGLEPEEAARLSDRKVASCVEHINTGVFRLEVPWDDERRILVNALDQGSKGSPI